MTETKTTTLAEITKFILSLASVGALIAAVLLPALGYSEIPPEGFIALVALATSAMAFHFGTSVGSQKKDETIKAQALNISTLPTTIIAGSPTTIEVKDELKL